MTCDEKYIASDFGTWVRNQSVNPVQLGIYIDYVTLETICVYVTPEYWRTVNKSVSRKHNNSIMFIFI